MAKKIKEAAQKSEVNTVRQEIANLCTTIGDRSYVIRQATADIANFYSQIDALRTKLLTLEAPANGGSEVTK